MATRTPSSKLLSQLLAASKRSPLRPRPRALSLRPTNHTPPPIRTLSSTRLLLKEKENTAPPPPSQSSTNTPIKTTQTPTGSTQQPSSSSSSSSSSPSTPTPHKKYTFPELRTLLSRSHASRPTNKILIDVREPSELQTTGHIPGAINLPLKSSPEFPFLSPEEFEDRFGRPRPTQNDEVIFYCRSGVRSKAAAELARTAGFGGTVSEYPGSWLDWEENKGEVER